MLSVKEVKDDGRVKTAARWREEGWVGAKLEGMMGAVGTGAGERDARP